MLKKVNCILIVFAMLSVGIISQIPQFPGFVRVSFAQGESPDNPILIYNVYDLQNISNNLSAHYALANDIDASITKTWNNGLGFMPIGDYNNPFTGSFNGNGYVITGLYINRPWFMLVYLDV